MRIRTTLAVLALTGAALLATAGPAAADDDDTTPVSGSFFSMGGSANDPLGTIVASGSVGGFGQADLSTLG